MTSFTEKERKEKVEFMGYFNKVMAELWIVANEEQREKISELKHKGFFHTPIPEMEELLKEAHEHLGVKPKTKRMKEVEESRKRLWEFLKEQHDLTLLDSELEEIIQEVVKYLEVVKGEE